jgi:hypothetical protein
VIEVSLHYNLVHLWHLHLQTQEACPVPELVELFHLKHTNNVKWCHSIITVHSACSF